MRVIRFMQEDGHISLAAVDANEQVYVLPQGHIQELVQQAEEVGDTPLEWLKNWMAQAQPIAKKLSALTLTVPVVAPEVWAAGVTYQRSREARNYEATGGKLDAETFYDKVYDAERPEIFMKSTAARTVGPEDEMYLRSDSEWQIPEPELGLVLSEQGRIIGYTIGNDLSCRDIEGENPLYLPQAKVWKRSCSIGPAVLLADGVENPYAFEIACRIYRHGKLVVEGSASTSQLKRKLEELVEFLKRDNELFDGTVLLTGTCVVPPNEFTLQAGDVVEIDISGIGMLRNTMSAQ